MRTVHTPTGATFPVVGLGTWSMGERRADRAREVAALRLGLDLGLTLIDTAEMYGQGGAEEVVAEAIAGRRDAVFLVTKVLPENASRAGTVRACEASLTRLGTDHVDLYLLHWPGRHPLAETFEAFTALCDQGKVRHYGVSNFDTAAMESAAALAGGGDVACNQVLYNLKRRGIEWSLLPWCRERGVAVMAYTPLEPALPPGPTLEAVAARHGATPAQVALAWTLREQGVVAIAKASRTEHVREIQQAAGLRLDADDLARLDREYPPPRREEPLATA